MQQAVQSPQVDDGFEIGATYRMECEGAAVALHTYVTDGTVTFDLCPPDEPLPLSCAPELIDLVRKMLAEYGDASAN